MCVGLRCLTDENRKKAIAKAKLCEALAKKMGNPYCKSDNSGGSDSLFEGVVPD